jgi:Flp pilus assembly protein TadG
VSQLLKATGRGRRAGQAVVEFALILPLFMLLVFGTLEFGRAYYDMHLLTNAARSGARLGTLPGKVEADVNSAVSASLTAVGMTNPSTTTVAVTDGTGATRSGGLTAAQEGDTVAVTVSYAFSFFSGHILPGVGSGLTLRGRCAFRHE